MLTTWLPSQPSPGPTDALPVEIVNAGGYDWGNIVVQVLIAIATVGALIWAIRVGRDEAKRAQQERRDRLEFEERAQATRISAWERQWVEHIDGTPLPRDDEQVRQLHVINATTERRAIFAHNGSDAPAYDVLVRYVDVSSVRDASFGDERDIQEAWHHQVLPPATEPRDLYVPLVPNCGALSEDVVLEIEFRDAAGRYWLRDGDGVLHRRKDLDALTPEERQARRRAEIEHDFGPLLDS